MAISKQNPMLGINKILSAITNPTLKNKFAAGINEKVNIAIDSDSNFDTESEKNTEKPVETILIVKKLVLI